MNKWFLGLLLVSSVSYAQVCGTLGSYTKGPKCNPRKEFCTPNEGVQYVIETHSGEKVELETDSLEVAREFSAWKGYEVCVDGVLNVSRIGFAQTHRR